MKLSETSGRQRKCAATAARTLPFPAISRDRHIDPRMAHAASDIAQFIKERLDWVKSAVSLFLNGYGRGNLMRAAPST